jgi:hypothetical protein
MITYRQPLHDNARVSKSICAQTAPVQAMMWVRGADKASLVVRQDEEPLALP